MKISFLGTGTSQGVPLIGCKCAVCQSDDEHDKRLRCSVHIEEKGHSFVIDSGPDFRQQMLRASIDRLDALIFTHGHKDHIAGMDDIRAYNFLQRSAIDVYADEYTQTIIRREFPYIFEEIKYPGIPEINLKTITNKQFEILGIPFLPVQVMHYRLPVLGFRVGDFTYITDANFIAEEEKEKIKNSKVLVLNALRLEQHVSHFTLDEAIELVKELKPEMAYFTHISHQMGKHADVNKRLPGNIRLAYDNLVLNL